MAKAFFLVCHTHVAMQFQYKNDRHGRCARNAASYPPSRHRWQGHISPFVLSHMKFWQEQNIAAAGGQDFTSKTDRIHSQYDGTIRYMCCLPLTLTVLFPLYTTEEVLFTYISGHSYSKWLHIFTLILTKIFWHIFSLWSHIHAANICFMFSFSSQIVITTLKSQFGCHAVWVFFCLYNLFVIKSHNVVDT